MDVNRVSTGEKIAGASGVALLLIMFIFDWFTVEAAGGIGGVSVGGNAWESFGFIDIVLLVTLAAAIALAIMSASQSRVDLPVAMSAITTGLGILSVLLILFRIISPPDFGAGDLIDVGRGIGVFLGLIAALGIAYGGWTAMQEEGTSFGDQADRLGGDRGAGPGPGAGAGPGAGTRPGTEAGTGTATPPPPPASGTGSAPPPPPPPPGGRSGGPAA